MTRLSMFLVAALVVAPAAVADEPATRVFLYEVRVEVPGEQGGTGPWRLWVPIPPNLAEQTAVEVEVACDRPVSRSLEDAHGNRMLYVESAQPFVLTARWRIERREVLARNFRGAGSAALSDSERARFAPYLGSDRLAPIDGEPSRLVKEVGTGIENRLRLARSIYDYVLANMEYKKDGQGWGRGSTEWACSAKYGNCTDFHALFIAMSRAAGLPARFQIGFPLPPERGTGELKGYHCWGWFYVGESGWIPVDISEARKHAELAEYYFGSLTEDRVALTTGRDLTLSPPQAGEPLNFFVHPYLEAAGVAAMPRMAIRYEDLTGR